ncbi:MAG: hypothetical protein HY966_02985 [Ignavibacteriales bacterium]|nr:hypothetical protein [Ignavibacteriales bacterium]
MPNSKGFDPFDLIVLVTRKKRLMVVLGLASFVLSYTGILLFVGDQYEATATIIGSEDQGGGMISGMLKSFESLPINLGKNAGHTELDKLNTIIFSRTTMEEVLVKFNLYKDFGLDSTVVKGREQAVARLRKNVKIVETEESAFQITCSANTPQRAADITNYLVEVLNRRVIDLKVYRSRENRAFLEKRLKDITDELRASEDSLKSYQQKSGMLEANAQVKEIISVYAKMETELNARQLQLSILESIYDKESPQVKTVALEVQQFEKKLEEMRSENQEGSVVLALKSLPEASVEYLRRFRKVEIGNALLKYIVPLYEQSKIEEKRDVAVLQVIDTAVSQGRRSYPPRVLFSLAITCFVVLSAIVGEYVGEKLSTSTNSRILFLRENLFQSWIKNQ